MNPYAVLASGTLGRNTKEAEDTTRNPFQRDRDRIIHTQAFRRLQGKTQVFVVGENDHYRTRLTHTMEVAQISRDAARFLGLNEDLAECIALAHDLGHPPFGHAGETAIDEWLKQFNLSFEHNLQSLRIVQTLEQHAATAEGLNLNIEVLEGLMKHRFDDDFPKDQIPERSPSVEAQLVNIADEIAYVSHDTDDGLHAGLFTEKDLSEVALAKTALEKAAPRNTSVRGAVIDLLLNDLYHNSNALLADFKITSLDDVYRADTPLICFSDSMRTNLNALRTFLFTQMYNHPSVIQKSTEGQAVLQQLCTQYYQSPDQKILDLQTRHQSTLPEAVKDYVSGMTDTYAKQQVNN